jgi:hypothetical protein
MFGGCIRKHLCSSDSHLPEVLVLADWCSNEDQLVKALEQCWGSHYQK